MKHIASCSFGKDSLAMIIKIIEKGLPLDEILYCRVMFNNNISGEYPEHEKFIYETAIPKLKKIGIKIKVVQAKKTYCDWFYSKYKKGKNIGRIYGFPMLQGPWCTGYLKRDVLNHYVKTTGEYREYVGIAVDEKKRITSAKNKGKILPLVNYGITENKALEICHNNKLLSPIYQTQKRNGCWFCHNQKLSELKDLRKNYPKLWNKLLQLQNDSPILFRPNESLKKIDDRFKSEEAQKTIFDFVERRDINDIS